MTLNAIEIIKQGANSNNKGCRQQQLGLSLRGVDNRYGGCVK
jgi:hypothetical protein